MILFFSVAFQPKIAAGASSLGLYIIIALSGTNHPEIKLENVNLYQIFHHTKKVTPETQEFQKSRAPEVTFFYVEKISLSITIFYGGFLPKLSLGFCFFCIDPKHRILMIIPRNRISSLHYCFYIKIKLFVFPVFFHV